MKKRPDMAAVLQPMVACYYPPGFMRPVVDAIPLSYLNDALREVVNYGAGFGNIGIDWLVLMAWAAGGFIASSLLFRWQ